MCEHQQKCTKNMYGMQHTKKTGYKLGPFSMRANATILVKSARTEANCSSHQQCTIQQEEQLICFKQPPAKQALHKTHASRKQQKQKRTESPKRGRVWLKGEACNSRTHLRSMVSSSGPATARFVICGQVPRHSAVNPTCFSSTCSHPRLLRQPHTCMPI